MNPDDSDPQRTTGSWGVLPPRQSLPPAQRVISTEAGETPGAGGDSRPGWTETATPPPPPAGASDYEASGNVQQPGNPQQPGVPGYPPLPGPTPSPDYPGYPPQPGYPPNWYPPQAGYSPQAYPPQYQSYPPSYYNAPYGYAQAPAGYAYSPSGWVPIVQAGPQPGLVWAGIGIRIGAMALDLLFLFAFLMAVSVVADLAGYHATGSRLPSSDASQWIWGLSDLFIFLLVPACWYVFQGTPGQRALGVRVVRASNGESLGLVRSALRYLVWVACLSSVVLAIVAAALAKQDPQKRAWTDLAGDSVVVRKG